MTHPGKMRSAESRFFSRSESVILLFGAAFVAQALVHGLRLDDDSYSHYAVSVQTLARMNWRSLIVDTWNKPLISIVYGIAGLAGGFYLARIASVALTITAAIMLRRVLERWLGWQPGSHIWFVPVFFLLQISLLPQVFLTMTEQIAAVLLSWSLFSRVRGRQWSTFLIAGLMPLARVESLFVVAALFVVLSTELLIAGGRKALARVVLLNCLGGLPFSAWWIAGYLIKGKVGWMSASYVYLRDPFWQHLWSTNAVTGLPGGVTAAHLLLVVYGLLSWRSAPQRGLLLAALTLPAAAHLVFASLMVVYPRGSGFGPWAILALNARSYATVSPLFCLLAGWGWQRLFGGEAAGSDRPRARLWTAVVSTTLLCFGYAAFQGSFALFGPVARIGQLALGLASLACASAIALSTGRLGPGRAARSYAWLALVSAPVMVPFFWYPLRWQDRKEAAQREFLQVLRRTHEPPPLVVQTMNGRLDFLGDGVPTPMIWSYPALLGGNVQAAPAGSWIVLSTDERGVPEGYPEEVVRSLLETDGYARVKTFVDTSPRADWQRALDRLTPRNRGGGWVILEKLPLHAP